MHPSWPDSAEVETVARAVPDLVHFGTSSWTYPGWTGLIYHQPYPAPVAG